jgi:2,5-furandicarboxylate decarboxylase 1
MHVLDGGPYISATLVVSKDPEFGRNVGSYRLMYRTPTETGIDLVSPSDMRLYYQRQLEQGRPLEIAVAIGVHPFDMLSASYKAPIDLDEFAISGGLCGEPVPLVKCKTVDLEVPADAELVLEGELLPIGWTADEGPFGEFNHISGEVKWNPIFRVKCITRRKDPIFYLLQMPWENDWLCAPVTEANGLVALRSASVQPVAIRSPVGSCGYWTLIASIRKRPGEGKNALLALLSVAEVKLAIVTDEDIDIFDPDILDWALTLRMQADKDVIIIQGARGKHIDPSTRAWELGKGGLPLTAKLGIDATIPEGLSKKSYQRMRHYGKDRVKLEDYT